MGGDESGVDAAYGDSGVAEGELALFQSHKTRHQCKGEAEEGQESPKVIRERINRDESSGSNECLLTDRVSFYIDTVVIY